jgi:hypothetical protein
LPVPHIPQELGTPVHESPPLDPAMAEANEENFFSIFAEPQFGHLVPVQSLDRKSISLSLSHFAQ